LSKKEETLLETVNLDLSLEIECQKVIGYFPTNLGLAIKYLWRVANPYARKYHSVEERVQNLNKAVNFIEFEIECLREE